MASGIKLPDGCEIGTFSPNEDLYTITIQHNLGEIPKIALCVAVPNCSFEDIPNKTILSEKLTVHPETGVVTSNSYNVMTYRYQAYYNSPSSTTYPASITATEVTFVTGTNYGGMFKAGVNYVYILIK